MGDVIKLDIPTTGHIPPDDVLEAQKGEFSDVVIIGKTEEGEYVFAGSTSDPQELLWMVELFKHNVISVTYEATE